MIVDFITFCDKNYAAQCAVMLNSLFEHACSGTAATVYSLGYHARCALQGWQTHGRLSKWAEIEQIEVVEMQEPRLAAAEKNRSYREWCWSLEPAIVHRELLDADDGDIICYTDADSFYFSDPIPAIRSVMEHADVALSPHHFPPGQESRERTVGKYNFGCGVFRACDLTRRIVGEWLDQTLEKCDEFGAGDQKYLDQWPDKLGDRLVELPRSINLGPWQMAHVVQMNGQPMIDYGLTLGPLISAHMHEFRRGIGRNPITLKGEAWNRSNYELHPSTVESVYLPYEAALSKFL